MKWLVEKKIIAGGFSLAILILVIVNSLSYQNTVKVFERQKQVEQSYEVLQKIRDILTTLRDAERARRGYIITGKEFYLGTYNNAIQEIDGKFELARSFTANNLRHQQKLEMIEPLIDQRVALIKKSVALYKQNRNDTAAQVELTDTGIMLHDEIWKIIAQMEAEEQSILHQRSGESTAKFYQLILIKNLGICLSFTIVFLVYWLLHKQLKNRQQSEEKFRQIADNINEIFWMSDLNLEEVLYVNPAYEKVWGKTCESLYADPKSFLNNIYPEDRERVINNLKLNSTKEFNIEYRIVLPDGSIRWVCDRRFPVKNAEGEVYRRAGVTQDITERKQGEEVSRTLEKEREINDLKLRFFSMASHEFRTPLSTILVSAQLLENSSKEWTEEKKLKNLHRIQSAAKLMSQLLTDILTLTRAESGNLEFNPQPLDLENFCNSVVEEAEVSYPTQQNIFFISQSPCQPACMDEKLLHSILTNLLGNAIKYSQKDSHIYLLLSCEGENAIFQIKDQGIGIMPEDKQKLYEYFYRGQNVRDVPGTGLGLPLVKKCVDLHGGTITVDSEVRVGTTFTVTIPLQPLVRN
ncbi:MAG: CHASE3 domain-containing protein [Phormidium sp.]